MAAKFKTFYNIKVNLEYYKNVCIPLLKYFYLYIIVISI